MLTVTSLLARTFDLDHIDLFWELETTQEEVGAYDFFVLRSIDGIEGPYNEIAGPFYNSFTFRDPNVHQLNKWRTYFYKLKLVRRADLETREYGPARIEAEPDRIALEIQRREGLMFKEHIGRLVVYFPALTFGQRCGHCWDKGSKGNYIGRPTQQNCPTCFDTTFVGGYAKPVLLYMQIDPSSKTDQKTDTGDKQYVETTGRTTVYPPLKPKDLIVEVENKRWKIETVNSTEKLRATVRQELKLRQYAPGDIKFKVPVTIDPKLFASPPREYSRPMTTPAVAPEDGKGKYAQPQIEGGEPHWWEGRDGF